MQAIILAAGQGTRIRPLSESIPKPMLPVVDRPIVAHVADAAVGAGADELVFVVGYLGEQVREYFGAEYAGVPVSYVEQEEQRGTADAVDAARDRIDGPFAVLNGDNLYDPESVAELFDRAPSVAAYTVDDPTSYGVLSTERVAADGAGVGARTSPGAPAEAGTETELVTDIVEKPADPPTNLANAGAYVFPAEATEYLRVSESERGEREITDVLERVIDEHDVTPVRLSRWLDVGRPWELLEATELLLGELERDVAGDVAEGADLRGPVVVEEGARVEPGVVVEGPALIRSGATVGPNAYIRGATVVGPGASVGNAVEIKNSVLMAGATVSHLSYVGDSVLGRDVNFGAGTKVANLRHDDGDVRLTVKGERVSTGRRKFGVVVGHGAKTGINTSLNAGVTLSVGASTLPGEVVTRDR
jgi:bifunctional UDP-N-acetylglucosamine pyrophosphorylase/glucosamine-1-phosphate N-acetyltransferase